MATDVKPKGNRLLMILGVAVFLGALLLNLALGRTPAGGGGGPARSIQVVVAAKEIPAATQLTKDMLQAMKFSPDQIPTGTYAAVESVVGKFTAIPLHTNQVVSDNELVASASGVQTPKQPYLDIPSGQVAMQIPTGELVGVGGFVQPEDRIDIIATQPKDPSIGVPNEITKTTFKNLRVLRVGPAGSANTRGISSSFTVLVPLAQAEELKFLIDKLSYKYVLKSVKDYDQADPGTAGVTPTSFASAYGMR
jgi:pilus assembly protein CpaB